MGDAYVAMVGLVLTAIITAIVGPIVTTLVLRRKQPADLDVLNALAAAYADAERRASDCEARERARRDRR